MGFMHSVNMVYSTDPVLRFNHPCELGINPTCPRCVIFLVHRWIWFASILWRTFASILMRDPGLQFSFFVMFHVALVSVLTLAS